MAREKKTGRARLAKARAKQSLFTPVLYWKRFHAGYRAKVGADLYEIWYLHDGWFDVYRLPLRDGTPRDLIIARRLPGLAEAKQAAVYDYVKKACTP